jgi:hypothetical protein
VPPTVKKGDEIFCGDRKASCRNRALFGKRMKHPNLPVFHGKFKIQDSFGYLIETAAEVVVPGSAQASCTAGGASANATLQVLGIATASTQVRVKARSLARAKVTGKANGVKTLTRQRTSLEASAKSDARVKIEGQATAMCVSTSSPPPHPPSHSSPPSVTVDSVQ